MACDLSLGRIEPCKDSVGGLNAIYFVNFGDLGAITYDVTNTDVIDAIAGTPSAYTSMTLRGLQHSHKTSNQTELLVLLLLSKY